MLYKNKSYILQISTKSNVYLLCNYFQPLRPSKLRSSTAPDIANEDFFPTLANARPEEQRKKKNEPAFEEVRHGGRVQYIKPNVQQPKSEEAENRFRSLEETDS